MKIHRYFIIYMILICFFSYNICQAESTSGFSVKGTTLLHYYGSDNIITVPKKVRIIGKKAFFVNNSIQKIKLQKGVTRIQSAAFKNCSKLEILELPSTIKKIASNAFLGCENLTIVAKKGSYALKFAKKHKIPWQNINKKQDNAETTSFYGITGITCYWYTAGTYPCVAEKKVITRIDKFDRIYEAVLLLNSGEAAVDIEQISGGKTLRVIIDFSKNQSRKIECNAGIYTENGISNKLAENASARDIWESIESDILEETL